MGGGAYLNTKLILETVGNTQVLKIFISCDFVTFHCKTNYGDFLTSPIFFLCAREIISIVFIMITFHARMGDY